MFSHFPSPLKQFPPKLLINSKDIWYSCVFVQWSTLFQWESLVLQGAHQGAAVRQQSLCVCVTPLWSIKSSFPPTNVYYTLVSQARPNQPQCGSLSVLSCVIYWKRSVLGLAGSGLQDYYYMSHNVVQAACMVETNLCSDPPISKTWVPDHKNNYAEFEQTPPPLFNPYRYFSLMYMPRSEHLLDLGMF